MNHIENTPNSIVVVQVLQLLSNGNVFTEPISQSLHSYGCTHYSIVDILVTRHRVWIEYCSY
jgi:hypothetical protein